MNDLIKRQDAIEVVRKLMEVHFDRKVVLAKVWDQLKDLPPAQRTGEWIETETVWTAFVGDTSFQIPASICSVCKKPIAKIVWDNYCPNCGADMRNNGDD